MNTVTVGRQAEAAVAAYLRRQGCRILEHNWRTRWCEIDVIAERAGTVYFCEVKYRRGISQGSGLDYITPKKLRQMKFAAEFWVTAHAYTQAYQLCAVEVSGAEFRITSVVKDLL